jgi:hypothetical protein
MVGVALVNEKEILCKTDLELQMSRQRKYNEIYQNIASFQKH